MMKQPVEQGSGKNLVSTEKLAPSRKVCVRGQNDRAMFIAGGHEFKELMRLFLRKPGIAHFIDDQQTRRVLPELKQRLGREATVLLC